MQVQKDETRQRILESAKMMFCRKGFRDTSMREIANASGVGLSNIYNYFKGKDEMFHILLKPAIVKLNNILAEHHDPNKAETIIPEFESMQEQYVVRTVNEYMDIITHFKWQLKLLFFQSQGSSLESFVDGYSDRCVEQVQTFMQQIAKLHPEIRTSFPDFTIRLHTMWMFTLFKEVIRQDISSQDIKPILKDYIEFECVGWRELISR